MYTSIQLIHLQKLLNINEENYQSSIHFRLEIMYSGEETWATAAGVL